VIQRPEQQHSVVAAVVLLQAAGITGGDGEPALSHRLLAVQRDRVDQMHLLAAFAEP